MSYDIPIILVDDVEFSKKIQAFSTKLRSSINLSPKPIISKFKQSKEDLDTIKNLFKKILKTINLKYKKL